MSKTKLERLSIPNLDERSHPVRHISALFCNKVTLILCSNCVRGFRVTKTGRIKSRLKGPGHELEEKTVFRDNHGQNTRDKLYISREIAHYEKSSISIFQ